MNEAKKKILWITRTGVLIALLIALQWGTSFTQAFAGQFITGSCVNGVLAVAVLFGGPACGAVVALASPFLAFLVGVGPKLIQLIPCIALGNLTFVLILNVLNQQQLPFWRRWINVAVAAAGKFVFLNMAVVRVVIPLMGDMLKPKQVETFTAMFSWPQLVTALIGGTLALVIVDALKKAFKK